MITKIGTALLLIIALFFAYKYFDLQSDIANEAIIDDILERPLVRTSFNTTSVFFGDISESSFFHAVARTKSSTEFRCIDCGDENLLFNLGDKVVFGDKLFTNSDELYSEPSGHISEIVMDSNDIVYIIENHAVMIIVFFVPQGIAETLSNGQHLTAHVNNRTIEVEITRISAEFDKNFNLRITAEFNNMESPHILPGSKISVEIIVSERFDTLFLHKYAIQESDFGTYVYVLGSDGIVSIKYIFVGFRSGGSVEILGGLRLGDVIIVPN